MSIEEIAGVHLGKAGDGSAVKPYVTPDDVDPSLLVGVPRVLNRTQYGIDDANLPFDGFDAWNCYEFSTLLNNGYPVSGPLKLVYSCDSPNIVESKSLKLYLNSYNMARLISKLDDLPKVAERISRDVSDVVGEKVHVTICPAKGPSPFVGNFEGLEYLCDIENMKFNEYNESPDILEVVKANCVPTMYKSGSLRSNCRVTNQPDWGDVYIRIAGEYTVTPESLLRYIVSMRKENHFHEEICECIYKRLYDLLKPVELFVGCLYTRRGGIDINPVRATNLDALHRASTLYNHELMCEKTARQ